MAAKMAPSRMDRACSGCYARELVVQGSVQRILKPSDLWALGFVEWEWDFEFDRDGRRLPQPGAFELEAAVWLANRGL